MPSEELEYVALSLAMELAKGPTIAIGLTKKMLNKSFNLSLEEALGSEAYAQLICARIEDCKEGIAAFLEKREPRFKGELAAFHK